MADRGVADDDPLQALEDRRRVAKIADLGAEIDERRTAPIGADLRLGRALLQRDEGHPRDLGQRREGVERHRAVAVVVVGRPAGPDDADAAMAARHQRVEALAPQRDLCRVGANIGNVGGDRVEPGADEARQTGQWAKGNKLGHPLPVVKEDAGAGLLLDDRMKLDAAGDCQPLAARGGPRDKARELDDVAIALVGDEEQRAVTDRRPVPMRLVGRRQQRRRAGEL